MTKKVRSRAQRARPSSPTTRPTKRPAPIVNSGLVDANPSSATPLSRSAFGAPRVGWRNDLLEWFRGKVELLGETRLSPVFGWIGDIPGRVFGWQRRPRISRRSRRRASGQFLWTWEEQGVRMLKQFARICMVAAISAAVLIVVAAAAVRIASAFSNVKTPSIGLSSTSTTDGSGAAVTINNIGTSATVLPMPTYTLGMWTSNTTPNAGGPTTIYALVSNQGAPVPHLSVSISVYGRSLTATTNSDGIASFTVNATSARYRPVEVNGSVFIDSQQIDASTFFTPI